MRPGLAGFSQYSLFALVSVGFCALRDLATRWIPPKIPSLFITLLTTVTVTTASPAVEPSRTTASSTIDETTVATIPILGRKFEDLLTLTPGVSIVQGPDGDEINFAGQRGVFNNISLDGGDYTNGFFGEQVGGQRAAIDITLDAVKEFQVVCRIDSPVEVDYFRHGGILPAVLRGFLNG